MNRHERAQELMAAAIDFPLTDAEVLELNDHLDACPDCRRIGSELRGHAAALAVQPMPKLEPERAAAILRAALRRPAASPPWRLLAVAAMLATLGGGLLAVGANMLDDPPESPAIIALPDATESPGALEPGPVTSPTTGPVSPSTPEPPSALATPDPGPSEPSLLPVRAANPLGAIRLAPTADNQLYVTVQGTDRTVVALLDAAGTPATGWPIELPYADDCIPLAAADGSVRVLCAYSEEPDTCVDVCYEDRAYAFDARGAAIGGWPVHFPTGFESGVDRWSARVIGTDLLLPASDFSGVSEEEGVSSATGWLLAIDPAGSVRTGSTVPRPNTCCILGPDGTAYGVTATYPEEGAPTSEVLAFGPDGVRSGWPVTLAGVASLPALGPEGRLYFTLSDVDPTIAVLGPDGTALPIDPVTAAELEGGPEWAYDVEGPMAPVVDPQGRPAFLVGQKVVGLEADGHLRDGWPYISRSGVVVLGECPPQDTGCQPYPAELGVGPGGLVYVLEEPRSASEGTAVTALNPDGAVRAGWPVRLTRPGSEFQLVVVGGQGTAYVLAIEPEGSGRSSATVLAIAPDSEVVYALTVSDP
jgi:Putative zinc-finger